MPADRLGHLATDRAFASSEAPSATPPAHSQPADFANSRTSESPIRCGKFLFLMVILPVLGVADVLLLRSGRGLSFWIRACGFEVCTVFAVAAVSRFLLDQVGASALLPAVN